MSLGRHGGARDGTSLVERALDAFVTSQNGRAVVMSCGNYRQARAHYDGVLKPGARDRLNWITKEGDLTTNELEIWYPNSDDFTVHLYSPQKQKVATVNLNQNSQIRVGRMVVGKAYHRAYDPNSPSHHIDLFLYPNAPVGAWGIELVGNKVGDGRWHASVERDVGHMSSHLFPHSRGKTSLGSICTGKYTIGVGAIDTFRGSGKAANFTSIGPTRDGRQKPDTFAPGVQILGAKSSISGNGENALAIKSGASQATPQIAGLVSLLFERYGVMTSVHKIRSKLSRIDMR